MNNPHFYAYGDTEVSNDTQPYHYTQCGLDDIFLLNGFHWYKVGNEGGVAVQDAEGLHKAIALNIVRNKAILCGKDVRFLRKLLDFTQAELALWLGYSSQQVARWEKDQGAVNPSAERLLRVICTTSLEEERVGSLEIIRELAELDCQTSERQFFRETEEGWQAAA